jgi:hypothetical protein
MKKIALALLFVFATGSAVAQTYACQFIMSAGMKKDPKTGWKVTEFNVPAPFFLNMSNGLFVTESLAKPPLKFLDSYTTCRKFLSRADVLHWCSDFMDYISFNEHTLNGAFAITSGAMQSSSEREPDPVSVSRFKCQKVR